MTSQDGKWVAIGIPESGRRVVRGSQNVLTIGAEHGTVDWTSMAGERGEWVASGIPESGRHIIGGSQNVLTIGAEHSTPDTCCVFLKNCRFPCDPIERIT